MAAKVFIAWSGSRGAQFAQELSYWLRDLPFASPWMSEDIAPGAQFFDQILHELEATEYGILCLTSENRRSPWLNFEAGFLKARNKFYPLMLDDHRQQVTGPLDFLQAKRCTREYVFPIIADLNRLAGDEGMDPDALKRSFDSWWWPNLKHRIDGISPAASNPTPPELVNPPPVRWEPPGGGAGRQDAFIIVDIQNDFFKGGPLAVPDAESLLPKLNESIKRAVDQNMLIVFTVDSHPRNHRSFEICGGEWPVHCVEHTQGAAFHEGLKLPMGYDIEIIPFGDADNEGLSPFENKALARLLTRDDGSRLRTVYVAGIALDYCVFECCVGALEFAEKVVALEPLIRSVTPDRAEIEGFWRLLENRGVVRGNQLGEPDPARPRRYFPRPRRAPSP